jgi:hypothetical protein
MVNGFSLVGLHIKIMFMMFEDYEREHLKEMIYLQEDLFETLATIIRVEKHDNIEGDVQEVRRIDVKRDYVGYDVSPKAFKRRGRRKVSLRKQRKAYSDIQHNS